MSTRRPYGRTRTKVQETSKSATRITRGHHSLRRAPSSTSAVVGSLSSSGISYRRMPLHRSPSPHQRPSGLRRRDHLKRRTFSSAIGRKELGTLQISAAPSPRMPKWVAAKAEAGAPKMARRLRARSLNSTAARKTGLLLLSAGRRRRTMPRIYRRRVGKNPPRTPP